MGTTQKRKSKPKLKSLQNGRPPLLQSQSINATLTSKATRTVIRKHHNTLKAHAKAIQDGDTALAERLSRQLTDRDLKTYQRASKTGQSASRGGDSSHVLVEWLAPMIKNTKSQPPGSPYRVLEIGALSATNAISRLPSTLTSITRIDLHSQDNKGIIQQDFMQRPLPTSPDDPDEINHRQDPDRFHIISLSLVLNYVASPQQRGEMLKRCTKFFVRSSCQKHLPNSSSTPTDASNTNPPPLLPCLFIVLPLPCLLNSRYLTETHFQSIMSSLNFDLLQKKSTGKLWYSLWRWRGSSSSSSYDGDAGSTETGSRNPPRGRATKQKFPKRELVPGATRNNFSIVLE